MASPTFTSVGYTRPDNTMQIRTPGAPGSAGGGPLDMSALIAAAQAKAMMKAQESARLAAMQERELAMRERMQRAQLDAMARQPPQHGTEGRGGGAGGEGRGQVQAQAMAQGGGDDGRVPVYILQDTMQETAPQNRNAIQSGYKRWTGKEWVYFR